MKKTVFLTITLLSLFIWPFMACDDAQVFGLKGSGVDHEQANGVGTGTFDQVVRVRIVALGLTHLGAVFGQDCALKASQFA